MPTTRMSLCPSSNADKPWRTIPWPSTTRTLIGETERLCIISGRCSENPCSVRSGCAHRTRETRRAPHLSHLLCCVDPHAVLQQPQCVSGLTSLAGLGVPAVVAGLRCRVAAGISTRRSQESQDARVNPAHVLVVDDNRSNRQLLAGLLAFEGYIVSEASDGAEGLDIARAGGLQLVISDILMPTMDGYEFVRRLRADPVTTDLPVIFYTANYHEREAMTLARQCGVERVLVKPCPAPVLIQTVAEVLADAEAHPAVVVDPGFEPAHLRLLTDKLSIKAAELQAANGSLAALIELNLQMALVRDPRELLESVCSGARSLLGARFAVLTVTGSRHTEDVMTCVSGLADQPTASACDPRQDSGVLGRVFAERRSMRLAQDDGSPLQLGLPPQFPAVRAAVMAPVCSLGRTYGWLCLGDKLGASQFTAADERLLGILGAQLGRIYENGSLFREMEQQATQLMIEAEERGLVVARLSVSEERFRQLAENIQDVFFVASADLAETLYVSPAYERVWGRPASVAAFDTGAWLEAVHPADRARLVADLQAVVQRLPEQGRVEFRIVHPDSTTRWVLTRVFPIVEAGKVVRTVGVTTDITDSKLAQIRIMRLNRTYSVLSGINALIVRATDRDSLLQEACRLAVDQGGFGIAWCGLIDGTSGDLRPGASAAGAPDLPIALRDRLVEDSGWLDIVRQAARSQRAGTCDDLTLADGDRTCRDSLLGHGYRSVAAFPLVVAGQAAGCFVLITDVAGYFDEEEMRLLAQLAGDISFALDHIGKAERLRYLASHDALTGLSNRAAFEERIGQYLGMVSLARTRFAVMVADPERFNALNSILGRDTGDEVLRQAAARFALAAGGMELVARVGSDQFAALLPSPANSTEISGSLDGLWHRWLDAPFLVGDQVIELTARAGIAFYPTDGETAGELLAHAEAALRDAKDKSSTFGFYTAHMSERFAERLSLEKDLRRAMENGEYELVYQPKVDLVQRKVTGLEALIRWRRPGRGLVLPGTFIPLLEETGMITEVGAWALRRACLDRARWLALGIAAPRVAVNVSAVQLRRDDFVCTLAQVLDAAGKDAGLDIEVTETLLLDSVTENLAKLAAIRALGVSIALDDFGTGYSSLGYLARLPVTTLKIDRSFISSMLDDPGAMTLVSTIISLARSLKLETVAEGVESEEQAKILRLIGCDQMQGYLISKPLPYDQMCSFLELKRAA
ncbi:MAG: EAL domain-containing protein [Steroidobacteraceae bacterium]